MQTRFTADQLADPHIREADSILRTCVHCGFCTATCPTYVLLGDELDSPRGRIYLIKDLLETGKPASDKVARHLDRCTSCMSCMTTCPSGVDYGHLVDHARVRVNDTYRRPWPERALMALLAAVVPRPGLFRLAVLAGRLGRPFARLMPGRLKGMAGMAPAGRIGPAAVDRPQVIPAQGPRRKRVALMTGCAQTVLRPSINEATVRVLTRHGCEVVVPEGGGCCGAVVHHMGRDDDARAAARANVAAWTRVEADGGLDAVVINATGCGVTVRDYGHMLRDDPEWAEPAARMAAAARDVSEVLAELGVDAGPADGRPSVAYHAACSAQHGMRLGDGPKGLLADAGFAVHMPAESHICCGSAGTYNLLQPDLAQRLQARKVGHLEATGADVIAAGNIGCIVHIAAATSRPVVHSVELLDWATGGPRPY